MQWLIGLAVISVAIGFFLRWLAFGILADNRLRIGVCVAYTAVLGILHFLLSTGEILVSYNSVDFRPGNAMKDGLSAVFEFLTLIGFLWLLLSKKKN
ncbi:hypothetical protein SAMN05216308_10174 [Nitrosospira sp. Nsp13]|nr:hypothetical protein SAMN05216308_10174 [Nitrosospira sp. Nsp13]